MYKLCHVIVWSCSVRGGVMTDKFNCVKASYVVNNCIDQSDNRISSNLFLIIDRKLDRLKLEVVLLVEGDIAMMYNAMMPMTLSVSRWRHNPLAISTTVKWCLYCSWTIVYVNTAFVTAHVNNLCLFMDAFQFRNIKTIFQFSEICLVLCYEKCCVV